jgi:hypothetical protein
VTNVVIGPEGGGGGAGVREDSPIVWILIAAIRKIAGVACEPVPTKTLVGINLIPKSTALKPNDPPHFRWHRTIMLGVVAPDDP